MRNSSITFLFGHMGWQPSWISRSKQGQIVKIISDLESSCSNHPRKYIYARLKVLWSKSSVFSERPSWIFVSWREPLICHFGSSHIRIQHPLKPPYTNSYAFCLKWTSLPFCVTCSPLLFCFKNSIDCMLSEIGNALTLSTNRSH